MKLGTIYIEVARDQLAGLKAFYGTTLGLPLRSEERGESIWFAAGETALGFHSADDAENDPGVVNLSFEVDDVDAEAARLAKAGVTIAQGPMDAPWDGSRVAVLYDPVGHTVWLKS